MNLRSTIRFLRGQKTNDVLKKIEGMKRHPVFKAARFDIYTPSASPERLVILLGQVHTVWKGKIGNRERNLIVHCQARLCSYYAFFEEHLSIRRFGGEGIYEGLNTSFQDLHSFQLYRTLEKSLRIEHPLAVEDLPSVAKKILQELGKEWHQELKAQRNLKRIQQLASAVSGQSLFNYLRAGEIEMYPIEGERAYQKVLQGISALGHQIERLERSEEMKAVRSRKGKIKTQKEVQTVLTFNMLVREFNQLIRSDIRERATLEILRQKGKDEPTVVFTMGVGHRRNYLSLVKEYFEKSSTAFVFITPPELRISWWFALGVPLVILFIALLINFIYF